MTPAWIVSLVTLLLFTGFVGYRYGVDSTEVACQKHDEAQQQITIAAQNGVIATVAKQQTITQGVEYAHSTIISGIGNLYRLQPDAAATGDHMPTIPASTSRSDASTCQPSLTRYYKLNAKECDFNTAQLIDLQSWLKSQAVVH